MSFNAPSLFPCPGFPLSRHTPSSGPGRLKNLAFGRGADTGEEPSPVYYPGTEIAGYMPHRGDFARVRECSGPALVVTVVVVVVVVVTVVVVVVTVVVVIVVVV